MATLVVRNASEIVTCAGEAPKVGNQQSELHITTGAVYVEDGRISAVGPEADRDADTVIDAGGRVVMPGFVDCHTHAVFYGSRADEFEMRSRGMSYSAIARQGGGIRNSMQMLRDATDEQLEARTRLHFDRFLDLGTTSIEAKSGYGLSLEHEVRSLKALGIEHDLEVVRTCLAAHSVPPEFDDDRKGYLKLVRDEILPTVAREGLAQYCDVFCERGVFTFAESEKVLLAGKAVRLRGRVHADQLSNGGGARLAARVDAITADHLEFATKDDAMAMRDAGVIAVLLPAANHFLNQEDRAPARAMIGVRCPVALATDFNPGTAPTQSMPLVLNMACVRFGMSIAEAIIGATINAACAIERENEIGSIEPGKQADLIVCDTDDHRDLAYYAGGNPVRTVIKKGRVVRG